MTTDKLVSVENNTTALGNFTPNGFCYSAEVGGASANNCIGDAAK
jgi:hypothetical protein